MKVQLLSPAPLVTCSPIPSGVGLFCLLGFKTPECKLIRPWGDFFTLHVCHSATPAFLLLLAQKEGQVVTCAGHEAACTWTPA